MINQNTRRTGAAGERSGSPGGFRGTITSSARHLVSNIMTTSVIVRPVEFAVSTTY